MILPSFRDLLQVTASSYLEVKGDVTTVAASDDIVPQSVPTAARERAVEILTRHFATDVLTEDALEVRLQRVYAATNQQELDDILADLPAPDGAARRALSDLPTTSEIRAVLSGDERKVSGVVPRELKLRARLGYVEIDLTRAQFQPGVTTIDVRAFMGYVEMRLPAGVHVENDGRAIFGFFASRSGDEVVSARSTVHIVGRALFGYAQSHQARADLGP